MTTIRSVRGMKDWQGAQARSLHHCARTAQRVFAAAHYEKVYLPILEKNALFARSVGSSSDIVQKELYSFNDRNDELLSLRPEGTAGLVRAIQENSWWQPGEVKRFQYFGSMFRRERPQRGRYRQFRQFGAETFGSVSAAVDAELIGLSYQWFKQLGIAQELRLEINCLGSNEERATYRQALLDYLLPYKADLDADSQRRLHSNPLRILDSKCAQTQRIIQQAPTLGDYLQSDSQLHFEQLQQHLQALDIDYQINCRLVRGLDYYNLSVFEWITQRLGSQGTVCGGGRYDALAELLGGQSCAACGFAAGMERIVELLEEINATMAEMTKIYIVAEAHLASQALQVAQQLRLACGHLTVVSEVQFGSFKSQFKKADKSHADFAVIVAGDEWKRQQLSLKPLRKQPVLAQQPMSQQLYRLEELINFFNQSAV